MTVSKILRPNRNSIHYTPFRRRSSQPVFWLVLKKLNYNKTKANTSRTEIYYKTQLTQNIKPGLVALSTSSLEKQWVSFDNPEPSSYLDTLGLGKIAEYLGVLSTK